MYRKRNPEKNAVWPEGAVSILKINTGYTRRQHKKLRRRITYGCKKSRSINSITFSDNRSIYYV